MPGRVREEGGGGGGRWKVEGGRRKGGRRKEEGGRRKEEGGHTKENPLMNQTRGHLLDHHQSPPLSSSLHLSSTNLFIFA
jgi:hypothetical protein